jgi:hypothetical protein
VSTETNGRAERLELVATILLALATVATAWSGYQASRWNGEQAKAFTRASALRIESAKAEDLANAQTQVDVATFIQWIDAVVREEDELADFYEARFREEFKPAVDAWYATEPLTNRDAPLTPFAMPEYQLDARQEAERLDAEAEALSTEGRGSIERSTNYVLCVVLFAAALFFAGISTKLATPRLRRVALGFGLVVFIATVAWVATFPVNVAV